VTDPTDGHRLIEALGADVVVPDASPRELWTGWEGVLAIDVAPERAFAAWTRARETIARPGSWPVVAAGRETSPVGEEIFDRYWYGDDASPDEILRAAAALSPETEIAARVARANDVARTEWAHIVAWQLEQTRRDFGGAPSVAEVDAVVEEGDVVALERTLLDWEETRRETNAPDPGDHLLAALPHRCAIVLLPAAAADEVPAYLGFHGASGPGGHAGLVAILRRWHRDFGAELMASGETMLHMRVTRPPVRIGEAFDLTVEQDAVARNTLSGVTLRRHARALLERPTWFLHDRP
jgi:hypothetical protein